MDTATSILAARRRAGLTQAELARLANTSQATISAYESGAKAPAIATLTRVLDATGSELTVRPARRRRAEHELSGSRLSDVLALAEALPYRRPGPLRYPRLPA